MGKRSKQAKNKAQKKRGKPHKGSCYTEGCKGRGGEKFECLTCEKLYFAGKRTKDEIFVIQACSKHRFQALADVKKHAVVKHPVNLLRVMGAALKGEDIT